MPPRVLPDMEVVGWRRPAFVAVVCCNVFVGIFVPATVPRNLPSQVSFATFTYVAVWSASCLDHIQPRPKQLCL